DVRIASDARRRLAGRQNDRRRSADESRTAFAFEAERERLRRVFVADGGGAGVNAFDTRDADLQRRLVGIGRGCGQRFATGNAAPQNRRIAERVEHPLAIRGNGVGDGELHFSEARGHTFFSRGGDPNPTAVARRLAAPRNGSRLPRAKDLGLERRLSASGVTVTEPALTLCACSPAPDARGIAPTHEYRRAA